jgi:hypothetical protein
MPRHRRGGRAAGRTGRPLRRSAGRLRRARPANLRKRVTRCGNVRHGARSGHLRRSSRCGDVRRSSRCGDVWRSSRCGDVWRSSRCGHLRRGSWRRCLWHGRRARRGRCVRGRRCVRRGGARGWRSSLLMLRLRGRGCRHRSRNDKNCRDACVPLEHDTTLPRRPQVNARNGVRVSLAKGPRLTGGLHDVRQIR